MFLNIDGYICLFLLSVNFGLQMFWQIAIFKFFYGMITGGKMLDEQGHGYFKKKVEI